MSESRVSVADALSWKPQQAPDLILCDPPHLDRFRDVEEYREFTRAWLPRALDMGCPVIHSCGGTSEQLFAYTELAQTDAVRVWRHPDVDDVSHFYLFYNLHRYHLHMPDMPFVMRAEKPDDWYPRLIWAFTTACDLVVDPFCGRGEILVAASEAGREWEGCDLNEESIDYCRSLGL